MSSIHNYSVVLQNQLMIIKRLIALMSDLCSNARIIEIEFKKKLETNHCNNGLLRNSKKSLQDKYTITSRVLL